MVHQNSPHGTGRHAVEVIAVVPTDLGPIADQLHKGVVYQHCGLQRVARTLIPHLLGGQFAELLLDQSEHFFLRGAAALAGTIQDFGELPIGHDNVLQDTIFSVSRTSLSPGPAPSQTRPKTSIAKILSVFRWPVGGFFSPGTYVSSLSRPNCLLNFIFEAYSGHLMLIVSTNRLLLAAAVYFSFTTANLVESAHVDELRTVALSGDVAPGTPENAAFDAFSSPPSLNNFGLTAFIATLQETEMSTSPYGLENDAGIWSERSDVGLDIVARKGFQAEGLPQYVAFRSFQPNELIFNDEGQVAFIGGVTEWFDVAPDIFTNDLAVWSEGMDGLQLVTRQREQAPGTFLDYATLDDGIDYLPAFDSLVFNNSAQLAFRGTLNIEERGLWSEGSGSGLGLVAVPFGQVPGIADATFSRSFEGPGVYPTLLNDSGDTAFVASYIVDSGGTTDSHQGIFFGRSQETGLFPILLGGDPVGVALDGARYARFGLRIPSLNNSGQLAFAAAMEIGPGDVTTEDDVAVWRRDSSGEVHLVAREGEHAPGTPIDAAFSGFNDFDGVLINALGEVAFEGRLTEGTGEVTSNNDEGIWSEGGGPGLRLVAREGDHAPGTPAGVVFGRPAWPPPPPPPPPPGYVLDHPFREFSINSLGQVAVVATLSDEAGEVTAGNNLGIWAQDHTGLLHLVVRTGDLLDVDDGPGVDLRTVEGLETIFGTGNEDGRASAFNDRGQLAFRARFTDGTQGIFVSNLVAVPEPSGLQLTTFGCLVVPFITRQRRILHNI